MSKQTVCDSCKEVFDHGIEQGSAVVDIVSLGCHRWLDFCGSCYKDFERWLASD